MSTSLPEGIIQIRHYQGIPLECLRCCKTKKGRDLFFVVFKDSWQNMEMRLPLKQENESSNLSEFNW